MSRDDLTEAQRLSSDIFVHLFNQMCQSFGDLTLGGKKYRMAYTDEIEALGLDAEDPYLLVIVSESDRKAFEVEIEATVSEINVPDGATS